MHVSHLLRQTYEVFTTLKIWNLRNFKSPKKQRCKEVYVMHLKKWLLKVKVTTLEKFLTLAKEVEWAILKFDSLK